MKFYNFSIYDCRYCIQVTTDCFNTTANSNIGRDGPSRTLARPKVLGDSETSEAVSTSQRGGRGKSPLANGPSQAESILQRLQGTPL